LSVVASRAPAIAAERGRLQGGGDRRGERAEQRRLTRHPQIDHLIPDRDPDPHAAIGRLEDAQREVLDREVGPGRLRRRHPRGHHRVM
jgi:hypothetical protein